MDEFIKNIKQNRNITPEIAYNEIIVKLLVKKLRANEKLGNIGEYDSETLFGGKLFRGNVYIFEYDANTPTVYEYKGKQAKYTDNLPIILMTGEGRNIIRGINLNFCNKALKAIILNLIYNIDTKFYTETAEKLAVNKSMAISKQVYTFLNTNDVEKQIIAYLQQKFPETDFSMLFRNYSVNRIKQIRLVEPWQWKYLPFLTYAGSLKSDTLTAIQKISNIDKVRI